MTRQIDELVAGIASASNEQSQGISQINTAVSHIDTVTQANAAAAEESASTMIELQTQASSMKRAVEDLMSMVGRSLSTPTGLAQPPRSAPQSVPDEVAPPVSANNELLLPPSAPAVEPQLARAPGSLKGTASESAGNWKDF